MFNMLGASWPRGLWESLIRIFDSGIGNYAWAIIVLVIVLKVVLSPLDYLQKATTAKTNRVQAEIAPEMEKLQKVYGNNKQVLNQKQMELYKKHNFSLTGSCLIMLINLVVTMVVFFTFFASMRNIATFKSQDQYDKLEHEYFTALNVSDEDYETMTVVDKNTYIEALSDEEKETANAAVKAKYKEIKDSWFWIENIWKSDVQTNIIFTFDEYVSASHIKFAAVTDENNEEIKSKDEVKEESKTLYNSIMTPLSQSMSRKNGYYILTVLVVLVTLASQFVMRWVMNGPRKKGQPKQKTPGSGIGMTIFLVVIMGVFTFTSNAAFSLYMLTNQIVTTAITPLVGLIIKKQNKKYELKQKEKVAVSYKR